MREQTQQDTPGNQGTEEEVTAQEASEILQIGHAKLTRLFRVWEESGELGLPFRRSTLDKRVLLIKRGDIQALLKKSQGMTVQQARRELGISAQKTKHLIDSGELPVRANPLHRHQRLVDPERYAALLAERRPHRVTSKGG